MKFIKKHKFVLLAIFIGFYWASLTTTIVRPCTDIDPSEIVNGGCVEYVDAISEPSLFLDDTSLIVEFIAKFVGVSLGAYLVIAILRNLTGSFRPKLSPEEIENLSKKTRKNKKVMTALKEKQEAKAIKEVVDEYNLSLADAKAVIDRLRKDNE